MSTVKVAEMLNSTLPNNQILNDVSQIIWETGEGQIELEGEKNYIPKGTVVDVVTKAFFLEYFDIGFGTCYKVEVAIGGVVDEKHGIFSARYCFATLYYNQDCHLITVDFHKEMR